jgi:hypothetical protein
MKTADMFSKNGGKHRRDEKNHMCDESHKSSYKVQKLIYNFCLTRDESNLM